MRRKDREIENLQSVLEVMGKCSVCSLSLAGGESPYVIPMSFGIWEKEGEVFLYFHGSQEGMKTELIKKDGRAAFCMYCEEQAELYDNACASVMRYKSVCGSGRITLVEDQAEKLRGLTCIMKQYDKSEKQDFEFNETAVTETAVLKLSVKELTGKANKRPD